MTKRKLAQTILTVLTLAISTVCLFSVLASGETSQHRVLIPSLSKKIPADMMLAHVPTTFENVHEPHIDAKVREKEIAYTWYWLEKALSDKWTKDVNRKEGVCLSNVGNRRDDALVLSWSSQGVDFDIVDSRSLMVVINMQGGIKDSTLDAFKKFVKYELIRNDPLTRVSSDPIGEERDLASWGKIHVETHAVAGCYENPIEWYRTENIIVFVFNKILRTQYGIGYAYKAENIFGGAGIDDPTPYLRFENSNRQERAKLYQQKLPRIDLDPLNKGIGAYPYNYRDNMKPASKNLPEPVIDDFKPVKLPPQRK